MTKQTIPGIDLKTGLDLTNVPATIPNKFRQKVNLYNRQGQLHKRQGYIPKLYTVTDRGTQSTFSQCINVGVNTTELTGVVSSTFGSNDPMLAPRPVIGETTHFLFYPDAAHNWTMRNFFSDCTEFPQVKVTNMCPDTLTKLSNTHLLKTTTNTYFFSKNSQNNVPYKFHFSTEPLADQSIQNQKMARVEMPVISVAPTLAQDTGSIENGVYRYKITYVLNTGTETNASPYAEITATTGGVKLTISIPSTIFRYVKYIRVYRTEKGKTDLYYFVDQIVSSQTSTTNTYVDTYADSSILAFPVEYEEKDYVNPFGHLAIEYNNMLVICGDEEAPDTLYVSEVGKYDSFLASRTYQIEGATKENYPTGMVIMGGSIYIHLKQKGIVKFMPTGTLEVPFISQPISVNYGCDYPSICVNGLTYFSYLRHIYMFNGQQVIDISGPIQADLDNLVSRNVEDNVIKLRYDERTDCIVIYISNYDTTFSETKDSNRAYYYSYVDNSFWKEEVDLTASGDALNPMIDQVYCPSLTTQIRLIDDIYSFETVSVGVTLKLALNGYVVYTPTLGIGYTDYTTGSNTGILVRGKLKFIIYAGMEMMLNKMVLYTHPLEDLVYQDNSTISVSKRNDNVSISVVVTNPNNWEGVDVNVMQQGKFFYVTYDTSGIYDVSLDRVEYVATPIGKQSKTIKGSRQ